MELTVENVSPNVGCLQPLNKIGALAGPIRSEVVAMADKGTMDHGFGLLFGQSPDAKTYFVLLIDQQGQFRLSMWNGVSTDLIPWTNVAGFHTGTRNDIAIETDGQNIWCFINGKMAGSVTAPVPVKGYAGFYVTEFGMRARFSSLQVVQLSK